MSDCRGDFAKQRRGEGTEREAGDSGRWFAASEPVEKNGEDELSRSIFLAIAEPKPPARSPELGRRGIQSQTR